MSVTRETKETVLILVAWALILVTLSFSLGKGLADKYYSPYMIELQQYRAMPKHPTEAGMTLIGSPPLTPVEQEEIKKADEQEHRETLKRLKVWNSRPKLSAPKDDPPPRRILVGSSVYSVNFTSAEALAAIPALAATDFETKEIWLNPARIADLRDDLFHEVIHMSMRVAPHEFFGETEETLVKHLDQGLIIVLRDNPDLVEWLLAGGENWWKRCAGDEGRVR